MRRRPLPDGLTPYVQRDELGDERLGFKWRGEPISFTEGLAYILLGHLPGTPGKPWNSPEDMYQLVNVFGVVCLDDYNRLNRAAIRDMALFRNGPGYSRRLRRALMALPFYGGLMSADAQLLERTDRERRSQDRKFARLPHE